MMEEKSTRYFAQQSLGSWPKRWLRKIRIWATNPSGLRKLDTGARVHKPYSIAFPSHISIGSRTQIMQRSLIHPIVAYLDQKFDPQIDIGEDCYVGADSQFHCVGKLTLGKNCVLSDQVYISDVAHGIDPRAGFILDQPVSSKGPVVLSDGCFVGFGSLIFSGVVLGEHCVVAARSVVTRSFPAYTMVAGAPARCIALFDHSSGQWVKTIDAASTTT